MPIKPVKRPRSPCWIARGTHRGRKVEKTTGVEIQGGAGSASHARALEVCRAVERRIDDEVLHGVRPALPFSEAALAYVEAGGDPKRVLRVAEYLKDHPCDDIDDALAAACARAVLRPGFAPATYNREIIVPVAAVQNFNAPHRCKSSTLSKRKEPRKKMRWLTPEEVEAIMRVIEDDVENPSRPVSQKRAFAKRQRAFLSFLVGSGCRVGEMAALRRRHLYLDGLEAFVAGEEGGSKTAAARRMVSFPERSADAIRHQDFIAEHVFANSRGKQIAQSGARGGQLRRPFQRVLKLSGIDQRGVTLHTLRDTWATWFYAQTRDVPLLMARGGWTDAGIALAYTKVAPKNLSKRCADHGWIFEDGGDSEGTRLRDGVAILGKALR